MSKDRVNGDEIKGGGGGVLAEETAGAKVLGWDCLDGAHPTILHKRKLRLRYITQVVY